MNEKVEVWKQELCQLSVFVESQPHAALAVLTHGLIGKCCFMARTTLDISNLLESLETIICLRLLSQLTGHSSPGDLERNLFTLSQARRKQFLSGQAHRPHSAISLQTTTAVYS